MRVKELAREFAAKSRGIKLDRLEVLHVRPDELTGQPMLEAILPLPEGGAGPKAKAVVSTARTNVYESIPSAALLAELGKRVSNVRNYQAELGDTRAAALPKYDDFEKQWLNTAQPLRTDCETVLNGVDFVDVEIEV